MILRHALSALVATPLLVLACDEGSSGTTGRRIALEVKVAPTPPTFTTAKGWDVRISKALVATGAFYFFDGDTLFARRPSLVRAAYAHPGHYVPGTARGEWLTPASVDLLAGATLGIADGVTGPVRSGTFSFGTSGAGELAAHAVVLEGTAAKAGQTRSFRVEVTASELADASGAPQILGCPFAPADMQGDGSVTVTVKLAQWLDQVAFDDAPSSGVLPDGLARGQLVRGAKAALGYSFAYAPK